ncbi:MAG: DUF1071 domain-containing protein [Leptolyngbya sp. SIO4C1]|nr:DUF1071 domain-containing protein [Leptolyngbya sp. SIO4C1]
MIMQTTEKLSPPSAPGEWTLNQIQSALSRPLPQSMLETKQLKGSRIPYIPWHTVNRILDKYAPGWTWEVCRMGMSADRLFLVGRLTIPTANGNLYREATGTEELKRVNDQGEVLELAYGDPSSNAESMAFRRAAARFGLGLYLYDKG